MPRPSVQETLAARTTSQRPPGLKNLGALSGVPENVGLDGKGASEAGSTCMPGSADSATVQMLAACTSDLQQSMAKSMACLDLMRRRLEECSGCDLAAEGVTSSPLGEAGPYSVNLAFEKPAEAPLEQNRTIAPGSSTDEGIAAEFKPAPDQAIPEENGVADQLDDDQCATRSRRLNKARADQKSNIEHNIHGLVRCILFVLEYWDEPPKGLQQRDTLFGQLLHLINHAEEPKRESFLGRLAQTNKFQMTVALVIFMNAITTTYSAEMAVVKLGEEEDGNMIYLDAAFLSFYIMELGCQLVIHRLWFFCNSERSWNVFDMFLVFIGLQETLTELFASTGGGTNMTFMRSLRLMKIVKVFRLFRVLRFFNSLRVMLMALVGSFVSLAWCLLVLTFILYIFSLVIIQGVTGYMMEANIPYSEARDEVYHYYGSLPRAMLSLFQVTTGGDDWGRHMDMLARVGSFYAVVFLFYIAFFTFAVFNVLTGIFVENALNLGSPERDELILEQRRMEEQEGKELKRICHEMDVDGSGTIQWDEFETYTSRDEEADYLAAIGLDVNDAKLFFDMVTNLTGQNNVEIDGFVEGALKMKGTATSIDMQSLSVEVKLIHRMLKQQMVIMQTNADRLARLEGPTIATLGLPQLRKPGSNGRLAQR